MKIIASRFLSVVFAAAIAVSLATHAYSQTATPTTNPPSSGAALTQTRKYPTQFPVSEPNYTSKRTRDFGPFTQALANFSEQRRKELDAQLLEATVPKMQQLMTSGKLSATELVIYYLDRIQRYDINQLNSVMELNPDALEIAAKLDAERQAGRVRGTMHGIPVLIKDNIATGDKMHTTAGAYALKDWRPDRDAFLVQQLRKSGAVILGKANLSEWANYLDPAMPSGFTALGGQTRHPDGPFDPLGSSTGSAVSVAANLIAVSVGSETQGSIVKPAATNGVVGLKTSRGLVSGDYVIPLVDWMDVPGPIGRTVTDVATLLNAITGVAPNQSTDAKVAALAKTDFTQFLSLAAADKRRVGVAIDTKASIAQQVENYAAKDPEITVEIKVELMNQFNAALPEANRKSRQIIATLKKLGIPTVEVNAEQIPDAPDANAALKYGFKASINAFLAKTPGVPVKDLAAIIEVNNGDPNNRIPHGQGHLIASQKTDSDSPEYAAMRVKNQSTTQAAFNQLFKTANIDVLISDTQAYAPAGYPALTVPTGVTPKGEPEGVLLIGKYLGEPDLLAVGYAYEQATHARKSPNLEATLATFKTLNQVVPK